tara:strand:- start:4536 stop:6296 length:1761 start_codon:yes stop_codon:yes gene_type:complete
MSVVVLPDNVVNQIAAGEVVQRPVAAVKELIENSLDAGATYVEVEFAHGGKSLLRVKDNGSGMSAQDAGLALERHATSKLRTAEDLNALLTFGFRGEALPSIASISKFTLRTRLQDQPCGTEVFVNSGKLIHQHECGMAPGTSIEVVHLFGNVPARRKFLKSDNVEAAHIIQLVRLYSIAYPAVSFVLMEEGRTLFSTTAGLPLTERVQSVWSGVQAQDFIEFEESFSDFSCQGLLSKPSVSRSTRQDIITFVNGRPVDSRVLKSAISEGYHTFIPKGRYPLVFLFITVKPELVDVNIHPTKQEIRFRNEAKVRRLVSEMVLERLQELSRPLENTEDEPGLPPVADVFELRQGAASLLHGDEPVEPEAQAPKAAVALAPVSKPKPVVQTPTQERFTWRYVGKVRRRYALFETEAGLILFNMRAAHERVLYERIMAHKEVNAQQLLIPISLELQALEATVLEEALGLFQEVGFEIAPFGRNFFRVEALPDWISQEQGEAFIRDALGVIREQGSQKGKGNFIHEVIARLASSRAVRVDDGLNEGSIVDLAKSLLRCECPLTSPRGNPTYVELGDSEIDRRMSISVKTA